MTKKFKVLNFGAKAQTYLTLTLKISIKTRNTSRGAWHGQQLQAGPAKENCASGQRYGILCLKTFETIQQKTQTHKY